MTTTPSSPRMALLLIVPLWLATTLTAQQIDRQAGVSLAVVPARVTLNAGQTHKFSVHIEGAPAGAAIVWAVPDSERDISSISQDGVFAARIVGVYHVMAVATTGQGNVLKTAVAKVSVLGQLEF
jgi:Bacterial Ig-like domain (group 2)